MSENKNPAKPNAAEFSCTYAEFSSALRTAEFGINPKLPNSAQRGVIVETRDGQAVFSTFDLYTAVRVTVPCPDAQPDGTSLLDFTELSKTLAALVAGETKATAAATTVSLRGDLLSGPDMTVPISALDTTAYVPAPAPVAATVVLDGQILRRQLDRVLPTAGTDITLPVLAGVQITIDAETCTLAATDRYRFAVADLPARTTPGAPQTATFDLNISGSFLRRLAKYLKGHTGPVGIGVSDDHLWATLTLGNLTFTTRLTDGRIPRHDKLFPTTAAASLQIHRAALAAATKKCTAVLKAKGADPLIPISFLWDRNGALTLAPALPEARDRARLSGIPLPCETVCGDATALQASSQSLAPAYLTTALDAFTGDTVTVHIPGAENGQGRRKPVLLTDGHDLQGDGYRHILMPINLDFSWAL
ncbi:hypothetical protein AB0A60_35620 [Streptomyces sp. NPDC046275]|uniref:DNA polymerase III subunit beta family protein n=1 Tax=Streptomyces sp. NPDC046275 TaxID=3157201 RepID=UPI0033F0430C